MQSVHLVIVFVCFFEVKAIEKELTFTIKPGAQTCFYQPVKKANTIDIDYQVIDGGHGDLDINFYFADPTGRILITDYKRSENTHRYDSPVDGDFRFCFDNKFSAFNTKTVFFEFIIEEENQNEWESNQDLKFDNYQDGPVTLNEVKEAINSLRSHLTKARTLQELIKSTEARDRNLAEENFFKVNTYSMIQLALMIVVGFVQVIMVRSLFDDHSKVHKIWKKLNKKF